MDTPTGTETTVQLPPTAAVELPEKPLAKFSPTHGGSFPGTAPTPAYNETVRHGPKFGRYRRIAARLPTYLADAFENPSWLLMFVLGRFMPIRRAYQRRHPLLLMSDLDDTLFRDIDLTQALKRLATDGLAPNFALPKSVVDEIHDFAIGTPCFGNLNRKLAFYFSGHAAAERFFMRPLLTGHYFDSIERCAAIARIKHDPALQALASAYLGPQAKLAATRLWWSFPTKPREADLHLASQDRFHFDLDDWQTLKFFFYITAVDHEAGPHAFIRGSHRKRAWRHQMTPLVGHPTEDVLATYGVDNLQFVTGGSGAGFAEDPFGFHMGTSPRRAPRLMLEVAFGVSAFSKRRFYGEPMARKTTDRTPRTP